MVVKAARGVVGVLASVTLALAACGDQPPRVHEQCPEDQGAAVAHPARERLPTTGVGPEPPERGVWVGAWVKPDWPTPTGRAAAFDAFEPADRREAADLAHFHDWHDEFPGPRSRPCGQADGQMISWSGTDTRSITSRDLTT